MKQEIKIQNQIFGLMALNERINFPADKLIAIFDHNGA
jgi:hypothetical protein